MGFNVKPLLTLRLYEDDRDAEQELVHRYILQELMKNHSKSAAIKLTAKQLGIGERTVWDIVKEIDSIGNPSSPPKKRSRTTIYDDLDEGQKSAIRRHVHSFFLRNELPTCTKILDVVNADDTLPELKRTTLWKVLKKLGFKWEKRSRNNMLIERQDIILWRRRYLNSIRKFRSEGRKIYYLYETWVNAGHTKQNVWKDTTVHSARQALLEG
ncbi:hypothetical protein QE152_g7338 [Popillia japonica]|uniref:Transposase n=1 Tax=Popillia japonica TaxID=7064 RepID=A0AAW1MF60_POPJA